MANPSVTHTFSNGTTSDATQVNTNFTDVINAMTDGTKSFTIDAITAAGAAVFNGDVTLGNGSVDDITINGSIASTILIKTTDTYSVGSTTVGLDAVYFGSSAGAFTTKLTGAAVASSYTFTTPLTSGTSTYSLRTNGSGTTSWQHPSNDTVDNFSLAATVAANALTISLKGADGNDPSAANQIEILFRDATLTTGTPVIRTATAATSLTVATGVPLGHTSGVAHHIYVYALDNAGTVELAVSSSKVWDEGTVQTTVALGVGSDALFELYSTALRVSKAIRFLGRIKITEAAAGTWATAPAEISSLGAIDVETERQLTLAVSGANWTTTRAVGIIYKTSNDIWRLRFNIHGTLSAAAGNFTGTITGVVFYSGADQAITATLSDPGVGNSIATRQEVLSNTATFYVEDSATTFDKLLVSGDVELKEKPTI